MVALKSDINASYMGSGVSNQGPWQHRKAQEKWTIIGSNPRHRTVHHELCWCVYVCRARERGMEYLYSERKEGVGECMNKRESDDYIIVFALVEQLHTISCTNYSMVQFQPHTHQTPMPCCYRAEYLATRIQTWSSSHPAPPSAPSGSFTSRQQQRVWWEQWHTQHSLSSGVSFSRTSWWWSQWMSDLCWVCQQNSTAITHAANRPEEKITVIKFNNKHALVCAQEGGF